jgi:DNA repair ATPase RecN
MNEQIQSAIALLNTYGTNILKREDVIKSLKEKVNKFKPSVDEYNRLRGEIDSLTAQNKSEKKFLTDMKNMIEKFTDVKVQIGDPTLFDHKEDANETDKTN